MQNIFPSQKPSSLPDFKPRSSPSIDPSQAPSNKPSNLIYAVPPPEELKYGESVTKTTVGMYILMHLVVWFTSSTIFLVKSHYQPAMIRQTPKHLFRFLKILLGIIVFLVIMMLLVFLNLYTRAVLNSMQWRQNHTRFMWRVLVTRKGNLHLQFIVRS